MKFLNWKVWLVVSTVALLTTGAFADEVGARLERLEKNVQSLKEENQELRKTLGLEGKAGLVVVRPAGKEPTLIIGGLLQIQGEFGDRGDARFTTGNERIYLRRARINASGRFLEEFDFRIELDLAGTLAETSALRGQMTDGYVNWNRYPFASIRVGQFKTPFGYEQLYQDPRLLTIERSLVNDRLTLGRQLGVQAAGDLFEKRFFYSAGAFNGNGANNNFNENNQFAYVGRVAAVPWKISKTGQESQWSVGANAFSSKDSGLTGQAREFGISSRLTGAADNIFFGLRTGAGVDTQLRLRRLEVWYEHLQQRLHPQSNVPKDRLDTDGWYLQTAYLLVPNRLQAVVKYDEFRPDRKRDGVSTETWTMGANWFVKGDDLKLQLNYLRFDIPDRSDQDKVIARLQTVF